MSRIKEPRGLYLSKRMATAYPNGFCGAIITGQRGIGKSVFALNTVWELYYNIYLEIMQPAEAEQKAWEKALNLCKFTMTEVLDFIEYYANSNQQARCLIWDDAGTHASTMEWWANRESLKRLKAVLDTIRTGVSSLIITTPNESDLTKILRNYDDYIVQIGYTDQGQYRIAKGYLKRTLPSGTIRIYPKFKNRFPVYLPDWVYDCYKDMRNKVLIEQIIGAKELIK